MGRPGGDKLATAAENRPGASETDRPDCPDMAVRALCVGAVEPKIVGHVARLAEFAWKIKTAYDTRYLIHGGRINSGKVHGPSGLPV